MARRYQPDELLRLSASPLVKKPDNLPPAEEWMGPIPDPATLKKNNHGRENSNQETSGRRLSIFENRHTSRGSEDIVLGPPRTSFASASAARILGKSIDSNDKSSANDGDDAGGGRYNFRDKFFKDREFGDKDSDRRDTRFGGPGRRGGREDRDDWGAARQRRTFGADDGERKPRRNGDTDRWGPGGRDDHRDHRDHRDNRDQDSNNERGIRDRETGRFLPKRERGRHEQSWFRDDGTHESGDIEDDKRHMRNREWRQNRGHGHDRDWTRGTKFEQDPEWMDSSDRQDTKQAHTQEDFQRWKERMKAGAGQALPVEEKKEPTTESGNGDLWQHPETNRADGELFSSLEPSVDNSGLDKFFGLWGETKTEKDGAAQSATDLNAKKDTAPPKVQKASRFAGIFSPPAEPVNQQPEQPVASKPPPERPASGDADQEGFQRILQMLGGNKSRNTTPQADSTMQPRPPPPAQPEPVMPPMFPSPSREAGNRQDYMPLQDSSPQTRGLGNMETAPPQRSQKETPVHNRDSDLLLQLMQQAKISPSANSHQSGSQPSTTTHTPGVLNVPDLLGRPQGVQKQKTPTFLDDPAIANMQRPESNELREQGRRRGNNAPPMGYFDDVSVSAAQTNQLAAEANKIRLPGQGQSSAGLQRPPGFEQVPPPGWPNPQMPPPQQPGPNGLAPPPGIPNPPRNMNPGFPPGGPMPMHGGMPPPQNERQILSRNVSGGGNGTPGGSSAGFGPPPGMGAPPGYMNMQGPPPFPPMGNAPDGVSRMPNGNQMYFNGAGGGPPPQPPQQSRHPLDMFGNGGNDGNGRLGQGMMGGPYR